MTENLKNFLQKVSGDKELGEKLKGMKTKEEVIAFAKELGFELTEEDMTPPEGELNEDELATVAGGTCPCPLVGYGDGVDEWDDNSYKCACVGYGQGGDGRADDFNCMCVATGVGYDEGVR